MKLFSFFVVFLAFASVISAQNLQLVHGKRMRNIDVGTFIQVEVPKPIESTCIKCPLNSITGKLISVENDSLIIRVVGLIEHIVDQDSIVGYTFKEYTAVDRGPTISIPKKDVLSIVNKGEGRVHRYHPMDVVGNIIAIATISTLTYSTLYDFESDDLATVAIYALLTSAAISLFRQPFYMTSSHSDFNNKKQTRELWELK